MIKQRKTTNGTITLELADCPEDGGKYALSCDTHGTLIQDTNKQRLWEWATVPHHWCDDCRDLHYNNEGNN